MDDIRISSSFPAHPKTKKLKRRLGGNGCWALTCLWTWAGGNRHDGDLSGLTDEDIELAADWDGEEGALVNGLIEVGFLDGIQGERKLHDWAEWNPWASAKGARVAKARNAARARWQCQDDDAAMLNDATSMLQAMPDDDANEFEQCPPPTPIPIPIKEKNTKKEKSWPRASARFEEFWEAYPQKTGKKPCHERWVKSKFDQFADLIIADVCRRKSSDQRWRDGYVPNPLTYLNQERWADGDSQTKKTPLNDILAGAI